MLVTDAAYPEVTSSTMMSYIHSSTQVSPTSHTPAGTDVLTSKTTATADNKRTTQESTSGLGTTPFNTARTTTTSGITDGNGSTLASTSGAPSAGYNGSDVPTTAGGQTTSTVDLNADYMTFSVGYGVCMTLSGSFQLISYMYVYVNNSRMTHNTLTSDVTGLFLMSFSVKLASNKLHQEASLEGADWPVTLVRRSNGSMNDSDTSGSTFLVGGHSHLKVTTKANFYIQDRPESVLASWGGFLLSAVTPPSKAFAVEQTETVTVVGDMTFNTVHRPVSMATFDKYITPDDGVYFFSFVLHGDGPVSVRLTINGVAMVEASRAGDVSGGTMSRVTMVKLQKNDSVSLRLVSGVATSAAFYGFPYSPPAGLSVAWSTHRSTSLTLNGSRHLNMTFDTVLANEGSALDNVTSKVTIPQTGTYYLHINAGVVEYTICQLYMNAGKRKYLLSRKSTNHGRDVIGRAIIDKLRQGDVVYVSVEGSDGYGVYSDVNLQTSFTGFLIAT